MAIIKAKIPNVKLRKNRRKKGVSYYLDYSLNGERIRESLGFIDINTANQLRTEKINELLRSNGITTPPKIVGLKEAVSLHFDLKKKKVRPKTISSYKNYSERIIEAIDDLGESNYNNLRRITEGRFTLLADKIRENYENPHTVNNTLTFLKAVENTAIRKDLLEKKFSQDVTISKPGRKLTVQYYTGEELEKIWIHCDPFYLPMFKLIVSTGLRLGELINLTWSKVDLTTKQLYVDIRFDETGEAWKPKSNSSFRVVPITPKAKQILLSQKGKDDHFVFVSKKGVKLHSNTVYNPFVKARELAGVEDKGAVHALRHTFASICAQARIPFYKISSYLGHSREETTRLYAHLCPSDDAEELNKICL